MLSSEDVEGEAESRASKRLIKSCTAVLTKVLMYREDRKTRVSRKRMSLLLSKRGIRVFFEASETKTTRKQKNFLVSSFFSVIFSQAPKVGSQSMSGPVLPTKSCVTVGVAWNR